jgi:hypothetical protein
MSSYCVESASKYYQSSIPTRLLSTFGDSPTNAELTDRARNHTSPVLSRRREGPIYPRKSRECWRDRDTNSAVENLVFDVPGGDHGNRFVLCSFLAQFNLVTDKYRSQPNIWRLPSILWASKVCPGGRTCRRRLPKPPFDLHRRVHEQWRTRCRFRNILLPLFACIGKSCQVPMCGRYRLCHAGLFRSINEPQCKDSRVSMMIHYTDSSVVGLNHRVPGNVGRYWVWHPYLRPRAHSARVLSATRRPSSGCHVCM